MIDDTILSAAREWLVKKRESRSSSLTSWDESVIWSRIYELEEILTPLANSDATPPICVVIEDEGVAVFYDFEFQEFRYLKIAGTAR